MKKILLFSACVLLAFASCKKDSAKKTSSNTITATVGGTNINFSNTAIAALASDSGIYILEVQGISGTGNNAQSVAIGLLSEGPIVKGTYTFSTADTTFTGTVLPDIEYAKSLLDDASGVFGTNAGINIGDGSYTGPSSTTTVTITSISSTNVQGTFSGVLVNEGDFTTTETVTNGKFNVDLSTNNQLETANSRISAAKLQSFKKRLKN